MVKDRDKMRAWLDDVFPTLVRYMGVVLMTWAAFVDRGKNPGLIPAAAGMIAFKWIIGSGDRD